LLAVEKKGRGKKRFVGGECERDRTQQAHRWPAQRALEGREPGAPDEAVHLARDQSSKSLELSALIDLARAGRETEHIRTLGEIYRWLRDNGMERAAISAMRVPLLDEL